MLEYDTNANPGSFEFRVRSDPSALIYRMRAGPSFGRSDYEADPSSLATPVTLGTHYIHNSTNVQLHSGFFVFKDITYLGAPATTP